MLAMFLARKYTPAAYNEIGLYFGRRRHSTVISAEKTVEAWLQENAKMDGIRQMTVRDVIRHVESQLQVG
jgi:chromosomal replication initiator protein